MKKPETAIFTAHDDFVPLNPAEPERNLMRAILRGAIEDVRRGGEGQRDARRYIMTDEDHYLYSFVSICAHLGICPQTIRIILGLIPGSMRPMAFMKNQAFVGEELQ